MQTGKNQVPPTWGNSSSKRKVPGEGILLKKGGSLALEECSVFSVFASYFFLREAEVLEIGGAVPPALVLNEGVRQWIAVDPLLQAETVGKNYRKIPQAVTGLTLPPNSVDLVFSCNAMHHLLSLREVFAKIFFLLKPGGSAYLHFGPIWSAPDGHHLDISHRGLVYRFDGISIIPRWYHLAFTPGELQSILSTNLGASLAEAVVTYVYQSPWLNRHFFEDYLRFAQEAGFFFSRLDTCERVDYEEYFPPYSLPLIEELNREGLFERIRRRHGQDKRNFYCRDILMIITKPPYCR